MIVNVGKKGLVKKSDNLVDALKEFNPKKVITQKVTLQPSQ